MSFRSILVDGVFYKKSGQMLVKQDTYPEPTVLAEKLEPLLDKKIQITVHHWPPTPVIQDRWGGGCCMWEKTGRCPAGHHKNPAFLLNFSKTGVLQRTGDSFWLQVGDTVETLPLDKMEGHIGRIIAVTLLDAATFSEGVELPDINLDEPLDPKITADQVEKLEQTTTQLHSMMQDFQKLLQDMKKK